MSAETSEWLNRNVLIGFTEQRGKAWHYRQSDQGVEPNHYKGPIPIEHVKRRLFAWAPIEAGVFARVEGGADLRSDRHKAIVRSDTGDVLGIVSPTYTIHSYDEWLLENVSTLVGADSGVGSAGLLDRGSRAWVQVEVPETFTTPEGVAFRPFLTAATSLDGSMATTYLTGAQVVVCDNTLKAALKDEDAAKLRIRHSTRSELRVADAQQALDLLEATAKAFEGYVGTLAEIRVDDRAWSTFLRAHFPLKNESTFKTHPQFDRRAALNSLWREDPRVAPWSGTAYGVLAAVNTYEHHVSKGTSERSRAERNATRAINGRFDEIDTKTLGTLSIVLPGDAKLAAVVGPGAAR